MKTCIRSQSDRGSDNGFQPPDGAVPQRSSTLICLHIIQKRSEIFTKMLSHGHSHDLYHPRLEMHMEGSEIIQKGWISFKLRAISPLGSTKSNPL